MSEEHSGEVTPDDTKNKTTCHVCGEEIAKFKGLHYGGLTCYSCRAFFRRCHSADRRQPFMPPECKAGGGCQVSVKSRRKCAKCRYELCLQAGMNPSMVLSKEEKEQRFRKYYEKKAIKESQQQDETTGSRPSNKRSKARPARPRKMIKKELVNDDEEDEELLDIKTEEPDDPAFEDPKTMSDSRLLELCLHEVDKILQDCEQPLPKLTLAQPIGTPSTPVIVSQATRTVTLLQPRAQVQTAVIPRNILAAIGGGGSVGVGSNNVAMVPTVAGQFNNSASSTYVTLQPADQNYWSGNCEGVAIGGSVVIPATSVAFRPTGEKHTLERL